MAEESYPDMIANGFMQICRSGEESSDEEMVCGLAPIPDATVEVIAHGEVIWEGELGSDGTVEGSFDSDAPWHIELSAPLLEETLVSEDFDPTNSQTQEWSSYSPTLIVQS
ncbi:hypothetical protein [Glycomyces xiaoerkulensis]|uniref:hypothetical protein n=1 Tax=Glycomyces xiaoerkulensis TaxID=2038139 RepID=UPI0012FFFC2F|nr:hypothetical protein [Glycomyces xiaoerkulensis]